MIRYSWAVPLSPSLVKHFRFRPSSRFLFSGSTNRELARKKVRVESNSHSHFRHLKMIKNFAKNRAKRFLGSTSSNWPCHVSLLSSLDALRCAAELKRFLQQREVVKVNSSAGPVSGCCNENFFFYLQLNAKTINAKLIQGQRWSWSCERLTFCTESKTNFLTSPIMSRQRALWLIIICTTPDRRQPHDLHESLSWIPTSLFPRKKKSHFPI